MPSAPRCGPARAYGLKLAHLAAPHLRITVPGDLGRRAS